MSYNHSITDIDTNNALPGRLVLTSPYGMRKHPVTGEWKMHTGADFSLPIGTPIAATESGTVVSVDKTGRGAGGKSVTLEYDHGNQKVRVTYMHLSDILVSNGDIVQSGDIIAKSGNTGRSTGPHLHMGVSVSKEGAQFQTEDPLDYLAWIRKTTGHDIYVKSARGGSANLLAAYNGNAFSMPKQALSESYLDRILGLGDSGPNFDVTCYLPESLKASLSSDPSGRMRLNIANGDVMKTVALMPSEEMQLKNAVSTQGIDDKTRQEIITRVIASASAREGASLAYEQALDAATSNSRQSMTV